MTAENIGRNRRMSLDRRQAAETGERVSIEGVLRELPDQPLQTTRGRGWPGITVDLHAAAPGYAVSVAARDHHLVCYCPSGRGRLIQRRAGAVHDSVISAGMSIIVPAGYQSSWEGQAAMSARLRVPVDLVSRAAEEIGARAGAGVELVNVFCVGDRMIENSARLLLAEMENPVHPAQPLIAEAISCALASHLVRRYNASDPSPANFQRGLSSQILARIVSHIEDRLDQPITLTDLAAVAGVSRFHFSRLFRQSTGFSPIAYVERLRLTRAQELLRLGKLPIVEVALAVGFCDQSAFTRRFHRHLGTTPAAFARDNGVRELPRRY
jgi:AraC family transcriptional regulator